MIRLQVVDSRNPDATQVIGRTKLDEWALEPDRALPKLNLLAPAGKKLVVRVWTRAIGADGVVSVAEAELLRRACAALHCPLLPLQTAA